MRRPLSLLVLASALTIAAACSESNAPAPRTVKYELVSYGGASLPVILRRLAEISTTPGGPMTYCDDKLTGSTLELLKSGRFMETDSRLLVCDDGRPDAASQAVLEGTYTTAADSVVMDADLGIATHYLSFARLSDGGLTIYRREGRITGGATSIDPTSLVFRNAVP